MEAVLSIRDIIRQELNVKVNGRLWLETNGQHFLGPGPIELLERIAKTGSLNKAAAEMKMSYKKAWVLITNLNSLTSVPIVERHIGGENGGGSIVTEAGLQLIEYYKSLRRRFREFLDEEMKRIQ